MSEFVRRNGEYLWLWCPACDETHVVGIGAEGWSWNGDLVAPTISPSIKVTGVQWPAESSFHRPRHTVKPGGRTCCHSFVKAGRWRFLRDCTHTLAGRTVPMVAIPPDWP